MTTIAFGLEPSSYVVFVPEPHPLPVRGGV